jgi:hypothetical protein
MSVHETAISTRVVRNKSGVQLKNGENKGEKTKTRRKEEETMTQTHQQQA